MVRKLSTKERICLLDLSAGLEPDPEAVALLQNRDDVSLRILGLVGNPKKKPKPKSEDEAPKKTKAASGKTASKNGRGKRNAKV